MMDGVAQFSGRLPHGATLVLPQGRYEVHAYPIGDFGGTTGPIPALRVDHHVELDETSLLRLVFPEE